MKKFFKGLALVLALVLVLGTIPASNASAKVYTKKTLYLNGGSAKKNTAKLYKLAGVKKADAAKVTAESADSKIVKAGSKKLTAKAEGKVDVKISVDGKLVTTVTVTVKDLAKPAEVELKAQSVAQTASNAIQVVFNKEVDNLTKADFNIYYKAGDAKVYGNVVNTVKQNADNKKAWDVVFFSNFVAKEAYFVEVTGIELTFTAAGNTYKDVTAVKLVGPTSVVVSEESDAYEVEYYNAAGIDITNTVDESKFNVTISASDITDGYFAGDKIYFWTVGATATVKVKVEQLNDKYEYVTVGEDALAVTCVSKATTAYAGVNCWSFTAVGADRISKNYNKCNYNIAVGDTKSFQVIFDTLTGTKKDVQDVLYDDPGYRFESADPSIAIVTVADAKKSPEVYGVKTGTTYIKIFAKDTANKVDTLITAIEITVKEARKVTTITPEWAQTNLNVNGTIADSAKLTIKVADQYGDPINAQKAIKIKSADNYLANLGGFSESTFSPVDTGKYELIFSNSNIVWKKDGTYTGTITADGATVGVSLAVVNQGAADKVNGYKLAGVKNFDLALTAQTKVENLIVNTISLSKTYNGFNMGNITESFTFSDKVPTPATAAADTVEFVYTVAKNGSLVKNTENNFAASQNFWLYQEDGSVVTKSAIGTYVISAYKLEKKATLAESSVKKVDTVTFTITDSQLTPSFTQKVGTVDKATLTNAQAVFEACFVPTFDGKSYKNWSEAGTAGYSIVGVNAKLDTENNTLVIISVDFAIENLKSGSALETGAKLTIKNVPVGGIVYGE